MNVQQWLKDESAKLAPPAGPNDAVERIQSALQRSAHRRRLLTIGVFALDAVLIIAGLAFAAARIGFDGTSQVATNPTTPANAVLWVDMPGTRFDPKGVAVPPCRPIDIDIQVRNAGVWHGNATQQIALVNQSKTGCEIGGPPAVTLSRPGGPLAVDPEEFANQKVQLGPGAEALMLIGGPVDCGTEIPTASVLNLTLPGQSPVSVTGAQVPVACGGPRLVLFDRHGDGPPSDDPRSALEAKWVGPDSAPLGLTLTYVIRLSNPTDSPVLLDPCPSYTEGVNGVSETHLLNCAAGSTVQPGSFVDFEMKLKVPVLIDSDVVKAGWHLEVYRGTTVSKEWRVVD